MAAIPVPYVGTGTNSQVALGHYAVAQTSGAIAATPTALDPHASIRWAPSLSSTLLVLMRQKTGWSVISEITAAVRMTYQLSIARGFTVDYTAGSTAINMSNILRTNTMRSLTMANSQMGASGPRISTTGPMSGHTNTLDAAPFALYTWNTTTVSGALKVEPGEAGNTAALYEWTGLGQHPVVLSNNEGVVLQLTHTGWASGTVSTFAQWEWAEAFVF